MSQVAANLESIRQRIKDAENERNKIGVHKDAPVKLIAVSKYKPVEMIRQAYEAGQRDFGENYVQELIEKSEQLQDLEDIRWHLIGHLQSNKAKSLLSKTKNLSCIQTIDREKIASTLDSTLQSLYPQTATDGPPGRLDVMIQVNTSEEDVKSGCEIGAALSLAETIHQSMPRLRLVGLMCIGSIQEVQHEDDNPKYYTELVRLAKEIQHKLDLEQDLELSMGMSGDFEKAILMGSTNVRVGSSIFGERDKK